MTASTKSSKGQSTTNKKNKGNWNTEKKRCTVNTGIYFCNEVYADGPVKSNNLLVVEYESGGNNTERVCKVN